MGIEIGMIVDCRPCFIFHSSFGNKLGTLLCQFYVKNVVMKLNLLQCFFGAKQFAIRIC